MPAMTGVLHRLSARDVVYAAAVATFALLAARIWWLSAIVPGMDYPQFLVFVRAAQDYANPSSPFHGTYTLGAWFMPTSLSVQLVALLSHACGGSLEMAGKLLLAACDLLFVAAVGFVLHLTGRPRWSLALFLPLVHSRWAVTGGYAPFATALPLVVLSWGLTIRWLKRLEPGAGVALALCLAAIHLWHGIAFVIAGLGFAVFWLVWREPSLEARLRSVAPTLPALVLFAIWFSSTFGQPRAAAAPAVWMTPRRGREVLRRVRLGVGPGLHGAGAGARGHRGRGDDRVGRIRPEDRPSSVERLARPEPAAGPRGGAPRGVLPHADARERRRGRREPVRVSGRRRLSLRLEPACCPRSPRRRGGGRRGPCGLQPERPLGEVPGVRRGHPGRIDAHRIASGPRETLYYGPPDRGVSKYFAPAHPVLRELQQFATIRHGGLPNSSLAGYGINYVKYVDGKNPMPGLRGPPRWSPEMTKFDYVLVRAGQAPQDARFRLVDSSSGWELHAVCGSTRMPTCP